VNPEILTKEAQEYITNNLSTDIHKILLKKSPFPNISVKEIVEQIESKAKAKNKLPTWFAMDGMYYPNKLNLSQCSSEKTALYKASLIDGDTIADITAGLGVDCWAFSQGMKQIVHVEKNAGLSLIAQHNFKKLGCNTIEFYSEDGIRFLKNSTERYDWIHIDPSRRDRKNNKVFYLADCEPDVTKHIELFFKKSSNILIKTGPLLDLSIGLKDLKNVKEIHIVAVNNDVKEILWILQENYKKEPLIKTINFKGETEQIFQFTLAQEKLALPTYSSPNNFLYEPNGAMLKSGAFKYIGNYFSLTKLHPNSHLYTSSELIPFPGRIFRIQDVVDYSNKALKKLKISHANISTRNFPDSVAAVRRKLRIKEGGNIYLFCTTDFNQNLVLIMGSQIFES
jgi:hypothetical protein